MGISKELQAQILRYHFVEHWGANTIAAQLGVQHTTVDRASLSAHTCTRNGHQYAGSGFRAMWARVMRKALEKGLVAERFTFHDLRGKAGGDSEDDNLLGHRDSRTLARHYKRKPREVTPIRTRILDRG